MISSSELLNMSRAELMDVMQHGHPIETERLAGRVYNGISLGLPRIVERLTWKKFGKAFYRDPDTGVLRGWNIRMQQNPLDAAWQPRLRGCAPVTFGHYHVIRPEPQQAYDAGITIDYSCGGRARSAMARLRDPLVAVNAGDADLLLGWTYVDLGRRRLGTPSFFSLQRGAPLRYVPSA